MKKWFPAVLACCGSAPMGSDGGLGRGSAAGRKAFSILYKAFVLMLCMAVLSYTCLTPIAHAEAIALGLSLACTALIIVLLTSMGMKFQSNNAEDLDDWMTGKIIQFPGNGGNHNGPDWLGVVSIAGLLELINGKARVNSSIVNKVSEFGEFLMEDEGIVAGGQPVGELGSSVIVDVGLLRADWRTTSPVEVYDLNASSSYTNIYPYNNNGFVGVSWRSVSAVVSATVPMLVVDTTVGHGPFRYNTNVNNNLPTSTIAYLSNTYPTGRQSFSFSSYVMFDNRNSFTLPTTYRYAMIVSYYTSWPAGDYYVGLSGDVTTPAGTVITPSARIVELPQLGPGQYYEVGGAAFADAADASEALTNVIDDVTSSSGYQAPAGDPGGIEVPDGSGWLYETITGTGESIVTGIGGLFVPRPGFWEEYVDSISDVFDDRMGILTYPLSVLADFTDRVADVEDGDHKLVWDNIRWRGATVIPAGEYDFDDLLEDESLSDLYDLYMIIVKAIILGLFISLCWRKLEEIENG